MERRTHLFELRTACGPRPLEPFAFQLVGHRVEIRSEFLHLTKQGFPFLFPLFKLMAEGVIVLRERSLHAVSGPWSKELHREAIQPHLLEFLHLPPHQPDAPPLGDPTSIDLIRQLDPHLGRFALDLVELVVRVVELALQQVGFLFSVGELASKVLCTTARE